jgi:predicted dehydrogenase
MAERESAREDGIDAVSIVTPNHAHAAAAEAFLKAGIHVICDKPLTTTVAEAERLAGLARESGLIFAVTHNYTGYPLVRQARAMVQAGDLGAIRVVQVEYAQDWLATRVEATGRSRPSGAPTRRARAPWGRWGTSAPTRSTSRSSSWATRWRASPPSSTPSWRAAASTTTPT